MSNLSQSDLRLARRAALLARGVVFDKLPAGWTAKRSVEASVASRSMPIEDRNMEPLFEEVA
ncbi:hypothetical protein D3C80_22040 [compost metagenome]